MTWEVVSDPGQIIIGMQIQIERPKSGSPPDSNYYVVAARACSTCGGRPAWIMTNGSIVPDDAPCWSDGRVSVKMEQL